MHLMFVQQIPKVTVREKVPVALSVRENQWTLHIFVSAMSVTLLCGFPKA